VVLGRVALSAGRGYRLAMGGVALVLLLGAELGLSVLAFGRTIAEHLASYGSPAGALGLAGQVAFALFPLLRRRARARWRARRRLRLLLTIAAPGTVAMFGPVRTIRLEGDG